MCFSTPSKASIADSGSVHFEKEATELMIATETTPTNSINKVRKIAMVVSLRYRRRVNEKFTQKLQQDVCNARSIGVPRIAVITTPSANLELKPDKRLSFVRMPPEIRNEIYQHLLPEVTDLRDVTGLLCACKQIRQELSSMIVVKSRPILDKVVQRSIIPHQPTHTTTEADAFITMSKIQTHSHLRNVNVGLGLHMSNSPPVDRLPTFDTAFSYLNELLSLHLPYVTIDIAAKVDGHVSIADPEIRRRLIDVCVLNFKKLENTPGVTINAQHVIFEIGKEMWADSALVYPTVVVFVRSVCRQENIRYDTLFYDPRKESQLDYGDMTMIARLNRIVTKSREAALYGI
jgi:hypothetical protein